MPLFATLALINGTVLTMDPRQHRAQAVACAGERIVAVGRNDEIRDWVDHRTTVVDLKGQTAAPGFIDAHNHMLDFGRRLSQVDLTTARSIADLQQALRRRAHGMPPGRWVEGWGYDQSKLAENRHPTREELDFAVKGQPVVITHTSGHVLVANSRAFKIAGVDSTRHDPPGGRIDRDPQGQSTGVMRENAMALIRRVQPGPTREELVDGLKRANRIYLSDGVTCQCDMGSGEFTLQQEWGAWQDAWEQSILSVRSRLYVRYLRDQDGTLTPPPLLATGIRSGFGDERLKLGGLKYLMDGGIGPATAALYEPYVDEPDNFGILRLDQPTVDRLLDEAHRLGYQIAIHAIGDRAVAMAVEAIGKAVAEKSAEHRHRIEHCTLTSPEMISRIHHLGIIPVPQPHFISHLGDSWRQRLDYGRLRWAFPLRSWIDAGLVVPGSSDRPVVADARPLRGIADAVRRVTGSGYPLAPEEEITVEEALKMFTWNAAFAAHEEDRLGSIEIGKLADVVVLSEDPTRVESARLADLQVQMTIIDGEIEYVRA